MEINDADLVEQSQKGDMAAFKMLFERHQSHIYNYNLQMLRNPDDAKDMTQETFIRAFRSLNRLRTNQAFYSWLKRISINLVRDRMRLRRKMPVNSLDQNDIVSGSIQTQADNPQQVLERSQLQDEVRKAVSRLPAHYRECLILYQFEDKDIKTIARILGISTGTVKSRLSRARSILKEKLENYL